MSSSQNTTEPIPRNVEEMNPSDHFQQQVKWRNIHGEMIAETLADGIIKAGDEVESSKHMDNEGKFHFINEVTWRGKDHELHIVVSDNPTGLNEVITLYVPGYEDEDYDRWFK